MEPAADGGAAPGVTDTAVLRAGDGRADTDADEADGDDTDGANTGIARGRAAKTHQHVTTDATSAATPRATAPRLPGSARNGSRARTRSSQGTDPAGGSPASIRARTRRATSARSTRCSTRPTLGTLADRELGMQKRCGDTPCCERTPPSCQADVLIARSPSDHDADHAGAEMCRDHGAELSHAHRLSLRQR